MSRPERPAHPRPSREEAWDEDDAVAARRRMRRHQAHRRLIRRRRFGALLLIISGIAAAFFGLRGRGSDGTDRAAGAEEASIAPGPDDPVAMEIPAPMAPVKGARAVSVAATGDIMMGSPPFGLPSDGGASFFATVTPLLTGDVVIGNLEGTFARGGTSKCGAASTNCFAFRTPPSYARWLQRAGFTVMSLANNHAHDFGAAGIDETVTALTRAGLQSTGRPGTQATAIVDGQRVAVLGFAPYSWADPLLDLTTVRRRVAQAAGGAPIVVVIMHAGAEGRDRTRVPVGPETYLGESRGDPRAFAHAAIDAGADLVVGSGPHVLRGMELYRDRLIAYSLGNFAGYRAFGLGGPLSTSAVLQVTIRPDGTFGGGRVRPTQLVGQGLPAPGGDAIPMIRSLSRADFGSRAPIIRADGTIAAVPVS